MKFDVQSIIRQFNNLDSRARYGIFGLLVVFVVILDYILIMQFQLGTLGKMDEQIKSLNVQIGAVKTAKQRIDQKRKDVEGGQAKLKGLEDKIRPLQEVTSVMELVSRLAAETQVNIDQLAPAKEGQENILTLGETKYYLLPIVITAHSGYHMFGRFLGKLESSNLLFIIKDLRLENIAREGSVNLSITAVLKVVMADKGGPPA